MHSMKLFGQSNQTPANIPEDLQPYYRSQTSGWRRFVAPVSRILAVIVVVALIIGAGSWLISTLAHSGKADKATQTAQQQTKKIAENSKQQAKSSADNGASTHPSPSPTTPPPASPSAPANPAPSPASSPSTPSGTSTSNAQPTQLTNTGPGEWLGVVAVCAVIGAVLHHSWLMRMTRR